MRWSIWIYPATLLMACATAPAPPPEHAPPSTNTPAATPVQPATVQPADTNQPDPSKPPPEVQSGCLPECAMVHGKCQALVHPGPTFGSGPASPVEDEKEETEEIGPGPKRRKPMVKPCAAHCCRGQD